MGWTVTVLVVACVVLATLLIRERRRRISAAAYRTERSELAIQLIVGLVSEAHIARIGQPTVDSATEEAVVMLTGRHHVDARLAELVATVRERSDRLAPAYSEVRDQPGHAERDHTEALRALLIALPELIA